MENSRKNITILLVALVLIIAAVLLIFLALAQKSSLVTPRSVTTSSPVAATTPESGAIAGKMVPINRDLDLISSKINGSDQTLGIVYYAAGTFTKGKYQGYQRIVALYEYGPSGPAVDTFATKDNTTYVISDDSTDQLGAFGSPLNLTKVKTTDTLPTDHPSLISLNSQFTLNRNAIASDWDNTSQKEILISDFSNYSSLKSPVGTLTLYAPKNLTLYTAGTGLTLPPDQQQQEAVFEKYMQSTTQITAVDATGLAYTYDLTTPKSLSDYQAKQAAYKKAVAANVKDPTNNPYPEYVSSPNLSFTQQDINSTAAGYSVYNVALPHNCGQAVDTYVTKNIADSDLQKIGTANGVDVYALNNKNHDLAKLAFDFKIGSPMELFVKNADQPITKPSESDYLAKNPLLFIKDYWGRWAVLGEYDYLLPGGCGKPVVYLYPTQPTKVTVNFTSPMRFDVTIPTYHNGWSVLAQPDGTLVDQQPQFTNCAAINYNRDGSAYAKNACASQTYPYLFWAGQSLEKPYPAVTGGWIVARNDLAQFMNKTLNNVGFTAKEKNDMLSYWLPQMLGKNAPWYRVSFLQTGEMNALAPMHISPAPQSTYRLFLDYLPLSSKPSVPPQPQNLEKINRRGFTMVEWGGLLR